MPLKASGVTFRDATEADLPAILAIVNDAILNTTALWIDDPVDLDNRRAWFEARRSQGYPVIIAERDGQVAGFGSYGAFRTGDGYRNSVEHSIYVRADLRGQGIGAPLLRALEDIARGQGKRAMIGGVEGSNTASLQLHRKLGFVDSGRLPHVGFKFGRWLDLVFMTKALSA
ncbi:MAG: N-acetyltransferase family protein [Alphaproteobacteria bacterium]